MDSKSVNLEETNLADQSIFEKNAKFEFIESVGKTLVDKHKHLLSPGTYQIFFFPGDIEVKLKGGKIPIPDFSNSIKKSEKVELEKQLDEEICNVFSNYKNSNKSEFSITNKKGQKVGTVIINKVPSKNNEVDCWWMPQRVFSHSSFWNRNNLRKYIQDRVNKKEDIYTKETSNIKKYPGFKWLLLSDIKDQMGIFDLEFNISELTIETSLFERIFLIHNGGNKTDELKVRTRESQ